MADLRRRIDRLEELIGGAECTCDRAESQVPLVVIDPSWSPAQIRAAEDDIARVSCSVHPGRRVPAVRLSPTDARL